MSEITSKIKKAKSREGNRFVRCSLAIDDDFNKILGVIRGVAKVEKTNESTNLKFETLIEWKFIKERGSLEYKTVFVHKDINNEKFDKYNNIISQMIRSYFNGFTLQNHDFAWVDETKGELF